MITILLIVIALFLAAIFVRIGSKKPQTVNVQRGVLRLWLAVSALWVVIVIAVGVRSVLMVALPPLILGALFVGFVWIIEGFRSKDNKSAVRRVWVIAKGLLFRFLLLDGTIVTIPSTQLLDDTRNDAALASAFPYWSVGRNGPLDSLSSHPSIRDYLYGWAIDWTNRLGVGKPINPVQSDEKAVWITPDWKTVWFWLPDGLSMHEVASIPFERYLQDIQTDNGLLLDLADWVKNSPTREALLRHSILLAYLGKYTTEGKLTPIVEALQKSKEEGTLPPGVEKLLENDSPVAER